MSTEPGNIFERRFSNQPDDLSRVTEDAMRFIEAKEAGAQAVYLVNLVIEEMGTNLIKYGYDDTAVHEIMLRLEIRPGTLLVVIEDDGHEFNPLNAKEPDVNLPAEERALGGLGIHLVRKMAEQVSYERRDERNRLTVEIRR